MLASWSTSCWTCSATCCRHGASASSCTAPLARRQQSARAAGGQPPSKRSTRATSVSTCHERQARVPPSCARHHSGLDGKAATTLAELYSTRSNSPVQSRYNVSQPTAEIDNLTRRTALEDTHCRWTASPRATSVPACEDRCRGIGLAARIAAPRSCASAVHRVRLL